MKRQSHVGDTFVKDKNASHLYRDMGYHLGRSSFLALYGNQARRRKDFN